MTGYRVYRLDARNRILSRADLVARNDEHALQAARTILPAEPIEIWTGTRRVGSWTDGRAVTA